MFEMFYWSSIIQAVSRLPKETIYAGIAAGVVLEVHRRQCNVKIADSEAKVRVAEAEVEKLKLEKQIQEIKTYHVPE